MESLDLRVLSDVLAWKQAGHGVTLVTVVETWGSAPRPPGALLAVRDDGGVSGSVSGGCVEDDLIARIRAGEYADLQTPSMVAYGVTKEEATRFGLPCGGTLRLVQEPITDVQWIQDVLRAQPQHLNALVLAGSAALSEKRHAAAQTYWQQALALVPAESEAAQGLQQAVTQAGDMAKAAAVSTPAGQTDRAAALASPNAPLAASAPPAGHSRALIQGEVRVSAQVQSQIGSGATLFVYALAEEGTRRPVAIWRGTPTAWPVAFALSDSMGMGAPPMLSDLKQVRLVARISKTGAAQKQSDDFQVELPGVKTGVQGVVLNITGPIP